MQLRATQDFLKETFLRLSFGYGAWNLRCDTAGILTVHRLLSKRRLGCDTGVKLDVRLGMEFLLKHLETFLTEIESHQGSGS